MSEGDKGAAEAQIEALLEREKRRLGGASILGYVVVGVMAALLFGLAFVTTSTLRELGAMRTQMVALQTDLRQTTQDLTVQLNDARADAARRNRERETDLEDLREAVRPALARLNGFDRVAAEQVALAYLLGEAPRLRLKDAITFDGALAGGVSGPEAAPLQAARALALWDEARRTELQPGTAASSAPLADLGGIAPHLASTLEALRTLAATGARPAMDAAAAGRALAFYGVAERLNYRADACAALEEAVAEMSAAAPRSLKLSLAQAECRRKVGRITEANAAFAAAVARVEEPAARAEPDLAYQAFHGRGTTAIALTQETAEAAARDAALDRAVADLRRAAELRAAAGQIATQLNGSLENIGFALLRQGAYEEALGHTRRIAETSPLAWNTTVRFLAARELGEQEEARAALAQLRLFRRSQFNECEMVRLLGPRFAAELTPILSQTRASEITPECPKSA